MPAPPDTLIWYLAVFRRMFVGTEDAAASGDREAMWLYQWAADALHNVPAMLRRYDDPSSWQNPEDAARSLLAFPEFIAELGAHSRVVQLAKSLVSQEDTHKELGLAADLRDLNLAPDKELDDHLLTLYEFCVLTRQRWLWKAL